MVLKTHRFFLVLSIHGFKTHCCGSIPAAPLLTGFDRLRRSTVGSGTREDVAIAYELPVLHEVVYIAPVPAVFAAPALVVRSACTSGLRHRSALSVIAASAPVMEYVHVR